MAFINTTACSLFSLRNNIAKYLTQILKQNFLCCRITSKPWWHLFSKRWERRQTRVRRGGQISAPRRGTCYAQRDTRRVWNMLRPTTRGGCRVLRLIVGCRESYFTFTSRWGEKLTNVGKRVSGMAFLLWDKLGVLKCFEFSRWD